MQHLIASYGYLAVFLLMAAESACIPVPSELVMTFGGALAAGAVPGTRLNIVAVIAVGVAGNVAGSYIAWAAGRYGGQPALHRWGRLLWLGDHDLDRASRWFDRYGARAVLIGRVLPVVRTFISLPAGIAGMKPVRFGLYTAIGCIPWTVALAWPVTPSARTGSRSPAASAVRRTSSPRRWCWCWPSPYGVTPGGAG